MPGSVIFLNCWPGPGEYEAPCAADADLWFWLGLYGT
jgi:hypothetical protein